MSEFEQDFAQLFMHGVCLISEGEYEEAVTVFDQVIDMEPVCAEAYSQRGYAKFHLDRHDESLDDLNRAIEISPDSVDAFAFRARTHWATGGYQQAMEDVTHALELDPDNEHALHVRAFVHVELDNYREAISDFDRILELSPDDLHARFMRGWAKQSLGQPEEALADNDLLLEADPYEAKYLVQRSVLCSTLERYEDALACAEAAHREHYDGKRPTQYYMGMALLQLGRYDEALVRFREIEDDQSYLTMYGRAVVLGRLGQIDACRDQLSEAARLASEAVRDAGKSGDAAYERFFRKQLQNLTEETVGTLCPLEPDVALRRWHEAWIAHEVKDHETALRMFGEALRRDPFLSGAYLKMMMIYHELERYDQAWDVIETALELFPDDDYFLHWKGLTLIDLDRYREALELFDFLIAKTPDDADNYYHRARTHYLLENPESAIEDLNVCCQAKPDNEMAFNFRATCYRMTGQFDKAVEDFSRVIYYHPGHIGALYGRAAIYERELERYEEAIRDLTQIIETHSEYQPAWLLRGRAWGGLYLQARRAKVLGEQLFVTLTDFFPQECFDADECVRMAIEGLTQAMKLAPEDLEATWFRGYYRYRAEDYPGAIDDFSKVVENDPTVSSAWYWMGWAYRLLGKYRKAVEAFDKALAVAPKDDDCYYARGMAKQDLLLFAEAEQDMKTACEINPENAFAVHYYAHALEWQGRFEESLGHFKKSLEMDSEIVEWYCCYADVLIKQERTEEAIEQLNASIALDPHQSQPYFYLGELYDTLGERDKAVEFYQLAIRSDDPALRSVREDDDINLTYRGRAFAGLGQHEKAVAHYLHTMDSAKTPELKERDLKHHAYWLAESYYVLGRFDEALELYRVALESLLVYHDRKERIARCRERIGELESKN
ncbi:MAG: tetratricopeptide repeat protein [Planctomycetaceae bacterium]|nr:tetratricopeptide repeat protein [Planctomycetaceae bacterium]